MGVRNPRVITIGFKILSSKFTGTIYAVKSNAVVVSIVTQLQIMAGMMTTDGPICTIPRIKTAEVIKLAPGIPTTVSPTPASNACNTATPITPCDTARIVAPARSTNPSARSGASLRESNLMLLTIDGPGQNRNPATIIEMRN